MNFSQAQRSTFEGILLFVMFAINLKSFILCCFILEDGDITCRVIAQVIGVPMQHLP